MRRAIEPFVAFNHVLIAGLAACVSATALDLFGQFQRGADEGYIIPLCFLAGALAATITRLVRPHDALTPSWFSQRLPELIGLAIITRLAGLIWHLGGDFRAESELFTRDLAEWLVGAGFIWAYLAVVIGWFISATLAGRFAALEPDERLIQLEQEGSVQIDRTFTRDQIVSAVLGLAMTVVVFTTLVRVITGGAVGGVWRIVLCFALVLGLLSQSRLALLRLIWARERVEARPGLSRRWAALTALFLGALAVLVLPLSTGYARDLLRFLNLAISVAMYALSVLAWLLIGAVAGLVAALMSLFSPGSAPIAAGPPPAFQNREIVDVAATPLDLRPLFFALLGIGALYFAGRRIWTYRREIAAWLSRARLGARLVEAARWVAAWLRGAQTTIKAALENARRGPVQTDRLPHLSPGLRSAGRLSPRERVLFFYRALLRRAAEGGLPRSPGQTPAEFAARIRPGIEPEAVPPVEALTDAYLTARYSRREVGVDDAAQARTWWERARDALRKRRQVG